MPITKAAMKALRQAKKRTVRKVQELGVVDGLLRRSRKAVEAASAEAETLVRQTARALDKAVAHGLMKRTTAGRLKSRIMTRLKKAIK